jgi:hypothetical protein
MLCFHDQGKKASFAVLSDCSYTMSLEGMGTGHANLVPKRCMLWCC